MTTAKEFLEELKQEAVSTRKLLERVPLDKGDWKPHEKSMALARLAGHIAENSNWLAMTILEDETDLAKFEYVPFIPTTTEELLSYFEEQEKKAYDALANCSDDELDKIWTMRSGEKVYFALPKRQVIRGLCINHMVHHRGQLTVYLRLLGVPLPGIYGPTADEEATMG
jgi:uncharacterized damage-inducible protein DinB